MSRARDIANYGDGIDTSSITSGTFADARIAQSNVTQHESAIDALGTVTSGTFNGTIGSSATFPTHSILQIQVGSYSSEASSNSSTFDDLAGSSFQVSITPSSTSNKILITCTAEIEVTNDDCHLLMDFYRNIGGTEVHFLLANDGNGQGAGQFRGKEYQDRVVITWCYVDSPSTENTAIVYRPTLRRFSGSGLFYLGPGVTGTNTITAMEIKQ